MREMSFKAILLGVIVGALLAAANTFVGLKVGMTISASIPAAVVSLLILRTLLGTGTLLESNMVQTIGSAGESVAAGMIFTIPALFIMGEDPAFLEMIIWGSIGGILGVCFMVPLRRVLIVKEHGVLPFPEGVACAEVLESGERGSGGAKAVIWGALVGGFYYFFEGVGFFKEAASTLVGKVGALPPVDPAAAAAAPIEDTRAPLTEFSVDSSPALLGVGYILGPRVAGYMLGGAVLSWFVLVPAINFFGASATAPVFPAEKPISEMSLKNIYDDYIRYIGAGAVVVGGLISLFKSFPTIVSSFLQMVGSLFGSRRGSGERTDKDFPVVLLLLILGGLGYAMYAVPQVGLDTVGVVAVLIFAFFFVTVSSRLVGIVGSSSNPASGMTIATLLGTALVYRYFVMDDTTPQDEAAMGALKAGCLAVGALVCIAICTAGDCSQDLKTGFLVKATPWKQQFGEMIGVLTAVLAIAGVLLLLNSTFGFTDDRPHPMPAPQANIMKILIDGVLGDNVPWTLIIIGGSAALIVELLGMPSLPFAVGAYLPFGISSAIMAGGLIRWVVDRKKKKEVAHNPGLLTASGLVAGTGLMGVAMAGVVATMTWWWEKPFWPNPFNLDADTGLPTEEPISTYHLGPWLWDRVEALPENWGLSAEWFDILPIFPFIALMFWLWWMARKRPPEPPIAGALATGPPTPIVTDDLGGPDEKEPPSRFGGGLEPISLAEPTPMERASVGGGTSEGMSPPSAKVPEEVVPEPDYGDGLSSKEREFLHGDAEDVAPSSSDDDVAAAPGESAEDEGGPPNQGGIDLSELSEPANPSDLLRGFDIPEFDGGPPLSDINDQESGEDAEDKT